MPAIAIKGEEEAVVKPVRTVDPELDLVGTESEAAPVAWTRDFSGMSFGKEVCLVFEDLAIR